MGIFLLLLLTSVGRAEPAAWQKQLAARQTQDRAELAQQLDLRMKRLHESQDNDDALFRRRLQEERDQLDVDLKEELRAFDDASKGDRLEDKKGRRRELAARQKARRAQLAQDQRAHSKKFYQGQREALEAEREFARQKRRQLEDDQRRELEDERRVMSKS